MSGAADKSTQLAAKVVSLPRLFCSSHPDRSADENYQGKQGQDPSAAQGDRPTGTLTSNPFIIECDEISFMVGGGRHDECYIALLVGPNRNVARSSTGDNNEGMRRQSWNVREWRGMDAQIKIADLHTGGWGHINVDDIHFGRQEKKLLANDGCPSNYAIMDQLEQFRGGDSGDGKLELRMSWPGAGIEAQHWKQESNPYLMREPRVDGYEAISCPHSCHGWGGLRAGHGCSLLNGSANVPSHWFYAVGSYCKWQEGFPGPNRAVHRVDLHVKSETSDWVLVMRQTHENDSWWPRDAWVLNAQFESQINLSGTIGLHNPTNDRWIRVTDGGKANSPARGGWNDAWGWERFEVHAVGFLGDDDEQTPCIGLRSVQGRWLRVTADGKADGVNQGEWKDHWSWERFEVHAMGDGQFALQNPETKRWLRVSVCA